MSQGQLPVCGWGVWVCGGASNVTREYKRNRFGGILMSSYLVGYTESKCLWDVQEGTFRRKCSAGSWKHRQRLWEAETGDKNL